MAAVITSGADTIEAFVSDYESHARSGNRVQQVLNRANPNAALRVAGLRTGTLTLTFGVEADSRAAELLHCEAGRVFQLASPERPTVDMAYIVADQGDIARRLNLEGHWTLTVDFQEVTG